MCYRFESTLYVRYGVNALENRRDSMFDFDDIDAAAAASGGSKWDGRGEADVERGGPEGHGHSTHVKI